MLRKSDTTREIRIYLRQTNAVKDTYTKGKVVEGTIGSADVWNNEVDRIKWFHTKYGTSVEEMEGAAASANRKSL